MNLRLNLNAWEHLVEVRIVVIFILFMEILEYKIEYNHQRARCKDTELMNL